MALRLDDPEAPERNGYTEANIDQQRSEDFFDPETRVKLEAGRERNREEVNQQIGNREAEAGSKAGLNGTVDTSDIQHQEESPTYAYKNNFKAQASTPKSKGFKGFLQANKKKGVVGAIISSLVLGALGLSFLTPGLLLIHITETITDKFDVQTPSLQIRSKKILIKKLSGEATSCRLITVGCKYNSINEKQLKTLRNAGLEVELAENKTLTGRYNVKKMSLNGKEINPAKLGNELKENSALRKVFDEAYTSKFAAWGDNLAKSVLEGRLKLPREPSVSGKGSDEDMKKAQDEHVNKKNGVSEGSEDRYRPVDPKDENGKWTDGVQEVDKAEALAENAKTKGAASELADGVSKLQKEGNTKLTGEVLEEAANVLKNGEGLNAAESAKGIGKKGLGAIGVLLALPDQACNVYGMYKTVSNGSKIQRAAQLALFAMDFLTIGSKIKAGDASPEEVSFLASELTKTVAIITTDTTGKEVKTISKPATDSYGYKLAAYGDAGPLTSSAAEFVTGGSGVGNMSNVFSIANGFINYFGGRKNVDDACGAIKSPFGQASIILGGIGITVAALAGAPFSFGGTLAALAGSAAVGFGLSLGLSVAQSVLTPMFIDLATGILIDKTTFGEKAGDALVSGSGYIMSTMAGAGGNAPLRPEEAVAYNNFQNSVLAQRAADERLALSPFDPSSRYTFMGRVVNQLVPFSAQTASISSFANTSYSVVTRSLASIFNPLALAKEATVATYTQCDDVDYKDLGLATDPFCNPVRGIPPEFLDIDPDTVASDLIASGDIDETSGKPKSDTYKNFIANCIDRTDPLGYTGEGFDESKTGRDCFIDGDTKKAEFYLYKIDQRVIDGMENGFPQYDANCPPATSGAATVANLPTNGTKISESDIKALITSYGLPNPEPDAVSKLQEKLTGNQNAGWAAQQMLNGEKTWASKGGSVKLYLNTAWVWSETGADAGPDPYEMNCNNQSESTPAGATCGSNFQVAGYQAWDRANDYVEVFKKLYPEDQLSTVMKQVISNSSKASKDIWKYTSDYSSVLDNIKLSDIAPNKDFSDEKTQSLTLVLGKDPAMAAALNSFAVSDGDLVAALKKGGCLYGDCSYYNEAWKQNLSNMVMALYQFDGNGPATSNALCSIGQAAIGAGTGAGIAAIFNGTVPEVTQEFGPTSFSLANYAMYAYAAAYGMNPVGHTGVDYGAPLDTKLYSPVDGTVEIAGGTPYFRSTDRLDDKGSSIPGTGELLIRLSNGDALILGHMHKIDVKVGDHVTRNQYVGLSGTENGPHVHVEYRVKDSLTASGERLVDPRKVL